MSEVPDGYVLLPSRRSGNCNEYLGPFFVRRTDDGLHLGLRLKRRHCNPYDEAHGGLLATLADVAISSLLLGPPHSVPSIATLQLDLRYLKSPRLGSWLSAHATLSQLGRRLAFGRAELEVEGVRMAEANAVLKIYSADDAARRAAQRVPA